VSRRRAGPPLRLRSYVGRAPQRVSGVFVERCSASTCAGMLPTFIVNFDSKYLHSLFGKESLMTPPPVWRVLGVRAGGPWAGAVRPGSAG
jgi:hypothetical protein